jgi:hypothetical protein
MRRGIYSCIDFCLWQDEVSYAPLNRRAWVVQERLLSPRSGPELYTLVPTSCYGSVMNLQPVNLSRVESPPKFLVTM